MHLEGSISVDGITDQFNCDKNDIGNEELTDNKIILNILKSQKPEVNECDESKNDLKSVIFSKCINWFETLEEAHTIQELLLYKIHNLVIRIIKAQAKQNIRV